MERSRHGPIPDDAWEEMAGVSRHEDLPCPERADLALVALPCRDHDGAEREGRMIAAREEAPAVARVFDRMFERDAASMRADSSPAFDCRMVGSTDRLPSHALGPAIDVKPIRNPGRGATMR